MQQLTTAFIQLHINPVSLYIPRGASLDNFEGQLGKATHLVVEEPIVPSRLQWLSTKIGEVVVLDVALDMKAGVDFTWFSSCTKLRHIALRSLSVSSCYYVWGFDDTSKRPSLESLTITKANISRQFLSTIRGLPLIHLSFEGSSYNSFCPSVDLTEFLKGTPTLTALNVAEGGLAAVKNLRAVQAGFPKIALTPPAPPAPVLRQNFDGVLTKEKALAHSYPLASLKKSEWDLPKLSQFLREVGGDEVSNWVVLRSTSAVYEHNVCKGLAKASPIQCPDRMRIAAEEPQNSEEILAFWRYARKLPLIVKVKTPSKGTPPYYPPGKGTEVVFGSRADKIVVECTGYSKHEKYPITERTLKIGGDTVHHIQVDWEDGHGLDVTMLSTLIEIIADFEKAHDGESLVHCTLGLGRTGTLIACQIIRALLNRVVDIDALSQLSLNLEELLRTLRQKRSSMIQHEDQLFTILEYTELLVKARLGS